MILGRKTKQTPASERIKEGFHPNRQRFEGCLTLIDTPSDKAPSGARGHRVLLTRAAAVEAMNGLIGMAIGFKEAWDGHNVRQRCGIIDRSQIDEQRLLVYGYVFCWDFPDLVKRAAEQENNPLGMSYELKDAQVSNMRSTVWTITACSFVGAAVLRRDKAAYHGTSFRLLPHKAGTSGAGLAIIGDLPADPATEP